MVSIAVKGEPVNICTDTLHDGDELRVSYGPTRYWETQCIQGFAVTMKPGTGGGTGPFLGGGTKQKGVLVGYAAQPL